MEQLFTRWDATHMYAILSATDQDILIRSLYFLKRMCKHEWELVHQQAPEQTKINVNVVKTIAAYLYCADQYRTGVHAMTTSQRENDEKRKAREQGDPFVPAGLIPWLVDTPRVRNGNDTQFYSDLMISIRFDVAIKDRCLESLTPLSTLCLTRPHVSRKDLIACSPFFRRVAWIKPQQLRDFVDNQLSERFGLVPNFRGYLADLYLTDHRDESGNLKYTRPSNAQDLDRCVMKDDIKTWCQWRQCKEKAEEEEGEEEKAEEEEEEGEEEEEKEEEDEPSQSPVRTPPTQPQSPVTSPHEEPESETEEKEEDVCDLAPQEFLVEEEEADAKDTTIIFEATVGNLDAAGSKDKIQFFNLIIESIQKYVQLYSNRKILHLENQILVLFQLQTLWSRFYKEWIALEEPRDTAVIKAIHKQTFYFRDLFAHMVYFWKAARLHRALETEKNVMDYLSIIPTTDEQDTRMLLAKFKMYYVGYKSTVPGAPLWIEYLRKQLHNSEHSFEKQTKQLHSSEHKVAGQTFILHGAMQWNTELTRVFPYQMTIEEPTIYSSREVPFLLPPEDHDSLYQFQNDPLYQDLELRIQVYGQILKNDEKLTEEQVFASLRFVVGLYWPFREYINPPLFRDAVRLGEEPDIRRTFFQIRQHLDNEPEVESKDPATENDAHVLTRDEVTKERENKPLPMIVNPLPHLPKAADWTGDTISEWMDDVIMERVVSIYDQWTRPLPDNAFKKIPEHELWTITPEMMAPIWNLLRSLLLPDIILEPESVHLAMSKYLEINWDREKQKMRDNGKVARIARPTFVFVQKLLTMMKDRIFISATPNLELSETKYPLGTRARFRQLAADARARGIPEQTAIESIKLGAPRLLTILSYLRILIDLNSKYEVELKELSLPVSPAVSPILSLPTVPVEPMPLVPTEIGDEKPDEEDEDTTTGPVSPLPPSTPLPLPPSIPLPLPPSIPPGPTSMVPTMRVLTKEEIVNRVNQVLARIQERSGDFVHAFRQLSDVSTLDKEPDESVLKDYGSLDYHTNLIKDLYNLVSENDRSMVRHINAPKILDTLQQMYMGRVESTLDKMIDDVLRATVYDTAQTKWESKDVVQGFLNAYFRVLQTWMAFISAYNIKSAKPVLVAHPNWIKQQQRLDSVILRLDDLVLDYKNKEQREEIKRQEEAKRQKDEFERQELKRQEEEIKRQKDEFERQEAKRQEDQRRQEEVRQQEEQKRQDDLKHQAEMKQQEERLAREKNDLEKEEEDLRRKEEQLAHEQQELKERRKEELNRIKQQKQQEEIRRKEHQEREEQLAREKRVLEEKQQEETRKAEELRKETQDKEDRLAREKKELERKEADDKLAAENLKRQQEQMRIQEEDVKRQQEQLRLQEEEAKRQREQLRLQEEEDAKRKAAGVEEQKQWEQLLNDEKNRSKTCQEELQKQQADKIQLQQDKDRTTHLLEQAHAQSLADLGKMQNQEMEMTRLKDTLEEERKDREREEKTRKARQMEEDTLRHAKEADVQKEWESQLERLNKAQEQSRKTAEEAIQKLKQTHTSEREVLKNEAKDAIRRLKEQQDAHTRMLQLREKAEEDNKVAEENVRRQREQEDQIRNKELDMDHARRIKDLEAEHLRRQGEMESEIKTRQHEQEAQFVAQERELVELRQQYDVEKIRCKQIQDQDTIRFEEDTRVRMDLLARLTACEQQMNAKQQQLQVEIEDKRKLEYRLQADTGEKKRLEDTLQVEAGEKKRLEDRLQVDAEEKRRLDQLHAQDIAALQWAKETEAEQVRLLQETHRRDLEELKRIQEKIETGKQFVVGPSPDDIQRQRQDLRLEQDNLARQEAELRRRTVETEEDLARRAAKLEADRLSSETELARKEKELIAVELAQRRERKAAEELAQQQQERIAIQAMNILEMERKQKRLVEEAERKGLDTSTIIVKPGTSTIITDMDIDVKQREKISEEMVAEWVVGGITLDDMLPMYVPRNMDKELSHDLVLNLTADPKEILFPVRVSNKGNVMLTLEDVAKISLLRLLVLQDLRSCLSSDKSITKEVNSGLIFTSVLGDLSSMDLSILMPLSKWYSQIANGMKKYIHSSHSHAYRRAQYTILDQLLTEDEAKKSVEQGYSIYSKHGIPSHQSRLLLSHLLLYSYPYENKSAKLDQVEALTILRQNSKAIGKRVGRSFARILKQWGLVMDATGTQLVFDPEHHIESRPDCNGLLESQQIWRDHVQSGKEHVTQVFQLLFNMALYSQSKLFLLFWKFINLGKNGFPLAQVLSNHPFLSSMVQQVMLYNQGIEGNV